MRYEYKFVDNGFLHTAIDLDKVNAKVNKEYGDEGWQLVSAMDHFLIFMRPNTEAVAEQVESEKQESAKQEISPKAKSKK
jgi:hypothetical protein